MKASELIRALSVACQENKVNPWDVDVMSLRITDDGFTVTPIEDVRYLAIGTYKLHLTFDDRECADEKRRETESKSPD